MKVSIQNLNTGMMYERCSVHNVNTSSPQGAISSCSMFQTHLENTHNRLMIYGWICITTQLTYKYTYTVGVILPNHHT